MSNYIPQPQNQLLSETATTTTLTSLKLTIDESFILLQDIWMKANAIKQFISQPDKASIGNQTTKAPSDFIEAILEQYHRLVDLNASLSSLQNHLNTII